MIEVKKLDEFDATVQRWFSAVEKAAAEAAVGLAKSAFSSILRNSPQFSGDFVANWRVSKGSPDTGFTSNAIGGMDAKVPYQIGDSKAIDYAKRHAKWPKLKLGEAIYLSNSARHDDDYAWKIENNQIAFRPMHLDAHHVVARAFYSTTFMNNPLTAARLDVLRKMGV